MIAILFCNLPKINTKNRKWMADSLQVTVLQVSVMARGFIIQAISMLTLVPSVTTLSRATSSLSLVVAVGRFSSPWWLISLAGQSQAASSSWRISPVTPQSS